MSRFAVVLLVVLSFGAFAQAPYEPHSGQAGKDVVWVPTPQVTVDRMLDMARVGPEDFVMDLGSGDGRLVISAAKRGASGLGVEYNPDMVALARRNAEKEGVAGRAQFVKADLFETDFSRATVITLFLLTDLNIRLRPRLLALRPGTRIVANTFNIGDWAPDQTDEISDIDGCKYSWCVVHLWIVPAQVAGTYRTRLGEVTLAQKYQKLSGTVTSNGWSAPLAGKVLGEEISFVFDSQQYFGRVKDGVLELR
ncbi:MAG TPA: class I SAM-dependent methyltransferase [Burkholderiales bacterium]|nr:class I SAM-dependent methyltransferase [Burkholderiales bacterium]